MSILMSRIRVLIALSVAAVSFAAESDTNVVVATAEKCQSAASVSAVAVSGEAVFERAVRAELKVAANDAKAEYKARYEELEKAHDNFMSQLNTSLWVITSLIALCGVVVPIIGFVLQWRSVNKTDEERKKLEKFNETSLELRRSRIAASMIMMHFTWSEFFNTVKNGQAKNGEILLPLYRMIEPLLFASKLGEVQLLNDCVKSIAVMVGQYAERVGSGDDVRFKEFIKQNRYFADASPCNLEKTLGGKTETLICILKFFNDFGITMFGEVDG